MHWSHWIGEVVTSTVMIGLALLFPHKPKEYISQWRRQELHAKFKHWDWLALPLLFVFAPAITWLFGQIFIYQYRFGIGDDPAIFYQLLPETEFWYVPALILAFGLVCYPMLWVYKLLLKERYNDYELYSDLKHGIDGRKVMRLMLIFFGVAALVAMHLVEDYYIKIHKSGIEANSLLELEARHYAFKDVHKLTFFKYNRSSRDSTLLEPAPHYQIEFKDHNTYNTRMGLHDIITEPKAVAYISRRSGVKVDTLDVDL
jgi:hypothetical protein